MSKKNISVRLATTAVPVVVFAMSAAACGSAAAKSAQASGTLRFVTQATQAGAFGAVIKSFEKAYPKVTVKVQTVPPSATYSQALLADIQSGNAPDVFSTEGGEALQNSASVIPLGKAGKILDLSNQSWASTVAKDLPKSADSMYYVGKKLYAYPLYGALDSLIYNETKMQQLGLSMPTTWSQLIAMCSTVKAKGLTSLFAEPGQNPILPAMLAENTVFASHPNWNASRLAGKVTFANTPGWTQAFAKEAQLNSAGCFQPGASAATDQTASQLVAEGQALITVAPSYVISFIAPNAKGTTFVAGPLPAATASSTHAVVSYSAALAVSASSKNKVAAEKFVAFVARPKEEAQLATASGALSYAQLANGKVPSDLAPFGPLLKRHKILPENTDTWPSALTTTDGLYPISQGLLTGQYTPQSAVTLMDQEWDK